MKNGDAVLRIAIILIVVALIFGGLGIAGGVYYYKRMQSREALKELSAASDQLNKEMQAKVGKEDTVKGSTEKGRQIEEALGRAASKATGEDAAAMRAAQRLMGSMQGIVAAYEKTYSGFLTKGGAEPKSLTSDAVIDERLTLLKAFEGANKNFTAFLKGVDAKYRAELAKEGISAARTDAIARGFYRGGNFDTLIAIRGADQELCTAMDKYLRLLKTEWGRWKVNESGAVIFENPGAIPTFNEYAKRIQEVADEQLALQQKVLKARQQQQQQSGAAAPSMPASIR